MANSASIEVFLSLEPGTFTNVTKWVDFSTVNYEDTSNKSSLFNCTFVVDYSEAEESGLLSPSAFLEGSEVHFRLGASGEHYGNTTVSMEERALRIKEVKTSYEYGRITVGIAAADVTIDMRKTVNTFKWVFPNLLELCKAMAYRYQSQLLINQLDQKLLESIKLPPEGLQQLDTSDRAFLRDVLRLTGKTVEIAGGLNTISIKVVRYIKNESDLYKIDIAQLPNNRVLSAEVGLERMDKEESAGPQKAASVVDEEGNVKILAMDQKGQLSYVTFDTTTGKYTKSDEPVEGASNPNATYATKNKLPEQPIEEAKPVYLVNAYVTYDEAMFNYLTSGPFKTDVERLRAKYLELNPNAIDVTKAPTIPSGSAYIGLYRKFAADVALMAATPGVSAEGIRQAQAFRSGTSILKFADNQDKKNYSDYILTKKLNTKVDSIYNRDEATSKALKGTEAAPFAQPFTEKLTPVNSIIQKVLEQDKKTSIDAGVRKNLAASSLGSVLPDTVKVKQEVLTTQETGVEFAAPGGFVPGLKVEGTRQTIIKDVTANVNYSNIPLAQAIADSESDEDSKKSLVLTVTCLFDPRYTSGNTVTLSGVVNPLHAGEWYCNTVEHSPTSFTSVLKCIRDYDKAKQAAGVVAPEDIPGATAYVMFDQLGNQKGIYYESSDAQGTMRYYYDQMVKVIDENSTINR